MRNLWRIGTPAVVLASGALFIVSATNSQGTDLRPEGNTSLSSLVSNEASHYHRLQTQVADLNHEVAALTRQVGSTSVRRYQQESSGLKLPAGLTPVSGAGLTVTLADAPDSLIQSTNGDPNRLVVHQQDVQAVVNALWRGGATAITIQGQRIISTTGIKCAGSAIQLQGVPYPEPFVIKAVGDINSLTASLDNDAYVSLYREQAADPTIDIGWSMEPSSEIHAPAYDGVLDLSYARPATR